MAVTPHPRIALDTSAYSHMRAGDGRVVDAVSRADVVVMSTIVLGELEYAFRKGSRYRANNTALTAFLAEPFVTVHDVDRRVAARYGELMIALRAGGTPIPANDVWIAATVMTTRARLITFDADFARVRGLDVDVLTV
jgi:tRNA(fMet)-specific endonuclease VapC